MRTSTRGAALVAAVGLLAALVLAGCGAGRDAPTSLDLPAVPGVNLGTEDQSLLVRNANVVFSQNGYATGGRAPVQLWLVNNTAEPIRLVEVTSDLASSVEFDELELAPVSVVETTFEATGLNRRFTFADSLPLTLVFDNGVEISAQVPMAPPLEPLPRERMTFEDDD
jgi:hypothetical protein